MRRESVDVLLVPLDHLHHLLGSRGVPRVLRVDLPDVALIRTCKRVSAQILSRGAATGGLAGGPKAAGATAQDEVGRPGPWLWQGGQWGAAAGEGGRVSSHLNRLEGTKLRKP